MLRTALGRVTSQRLVAQRGGPAKVSFSIRSNQAPRAPQTATYASSSSNVPAVVERAKGLTLTRVNGVKEPVAEVVQGKTVLGLLRHLG